MTPPLVMNWKMLMNLVASIGTPMKKEAMDTCFLLTVLTISDGKIFHLFIYVPLYNSQWHLLEETFLG